jgi:hypothetical protein
VICDSPGFGDSAGV